MKFLIVIAAIASIFFTQNVHANFETIDDINFSYSQRPTVDRINRELVSVVTITNNSADDINSPMRLIVDSTSHTILNAEQNESGDSYITLTDETLAAGASITISVRLAIARARLNFELALQTQQINSSTVLALESNQIAVFYNRPDGDYTDWGLHLWNGEGCGNYASPTTQSEHFSNWPNPYPEDGIHPEYGAYYIITIEPGAQCYNFIIHKGDEKALGEANSRFEPSQGIEAFTFNGFSELYYTPLTNRPPQIDGASAHWITRDTLLWHIQSPDAVSYALHHSVDAGLTIGIDSRISTGSAIALQPAAAEAELRATVPHLASFTGFSIEVSSSQARDLAKQQLVAAAYDSDGAIVAATFVQHAKLLDDLYTQGENDADETSLGINYVNDTVDTSVWAPTAQDVSLLLYNNDKALVGRQAMTVDAESGIWRYSAAASDVDKLFYRYELRAYHPLTKQIELMQATDPYSVSVSTNGRHTQIIDLSDVSDRTLTPEGWSDRSRPAPLAPESLIIYETHIRDFSAMDASTLPEYRGKYLAFTQTDSIPVQHLQKLNDSGVNLIHILPANDIASINEDSAQTINLNNTVGELCAIVSDAEVCEQGDSSQTLLDVLISYDPSSIQAQALVNNMRSLDSFNWGYDPHHFAAPEGSYASNPDGAARVKEMRAMVMSLQEMGFHVALDVVYNHTASSGLFDNSVLDKVVPGYYQRLNEFSGDIESSTCCENTATEHKMMAKLMTDSLVIFARDFGFDSFRFDLMGHIPKQAVLNARTAVKQINPHTYFYGEGWNFGEVVNDRLFEQASQLNMAGSAIGTFNDRIRESVRSAALFTENGSLNEQDILRLSLAGSLSNYRWTAASGVYIRGQDYQWNGQVAGYADVPADIINYVSKHDNETLWDQLQYNLNPVLTLDDRTRIHATSLAIPLLSQGIPFIHMGSELMRSKSLDRNTFDAGDWFNRVDFTATTNNWNIGLPLAQDNQNNWEIMTRLNDNPNSAIDTDSILLVETLFTDYLRIRSGSSLFALQTAEQVSNRVKFHNVGEGQTQGLIVMSIDDGIGMPDLDPNIDALIVLINGTAVNQSYAIDNAIGFEVHPIHLASSDAYLTQANVINNVFSVPPKSAVVFVKSQNAEQGEGLSALPPYGTEPIFLRGAFNAWSTDAPFEYQGQATYSVELVLPVGTYEFKIADENFSEVNIGGEFNVPVGSHVQLSNFTNNLSINITQEASYRFELNAAHAQMPALLVSSDTITGPPADTETYGGNVFLRGSMNDWASADEYKFSYEGDNKYRLSVELSADNYQFKLANEGFDSPNLGGLSPEELVTIGAEISLVNDSASNNLSLPITETQVYEFLLDATQADTPILRVFDENGPITHTLYIRGAMNGWGTDNEMPYTQSGRYEVNLNLNAGEIPFKIADESWETSFGAGQNIDQDTTLPIYENGGDGILNINESQQYKVIFDALTTPKTVEFIQQP